MIIHVCDGGNAGCDARRTRAAISRIWQARPTKQRARSAPSRRVVAQTRVCGVARLAPIRSWDCRAPCIHRVWATTHHANNHEIGSSYRRPSDVRDAGRYLRIATRPRRPWPRQAKPADIQSAGCRVFCVGNYSRAACLATASGCAHFASICAWRAIATFATLRPMSSPASTSKR